MPQFKILNLDQSVLGNVKKDCRTVSYEDLMAWAREKVPDDIPPFVWRTQLGLAFIDDNVYRSKNDAALQSLIHALGYDSSIFGKWETVEVGTAPNTVQHSRRCESFRRTYKASTRESGIVWSWNPEQRCTKALMYGVTYPSVWNRMKNGSYVLCGLQTHSSLRTNPLLLGMLMLKSETTVTETMLRQDENDLDRAAIKTGRHRFRYLERNLNTKYIDLTELSADACRTTMRSSGYITQLWSIRRSSDFIVEECKVLQEENYCLGPENDLLRSIVSSNFKMASMARMLNREVDQHLDVAQEMKWNSDILVQTVFTLSNQRDQEVAIEIARGSKALAEQTTKDSTSMKAIAAVTMFFLPGTFVASFFAMPMFSFHIEEGAAVSKSFWIYWAVTLPLTLSVVGIWLVWTNRKEVKQYVKKLRKPKRVDSTSVSSPLGSDSLHSSYSTIPAYTR